MNEWKKVKIGDVATIKHGFAFKGEFFSEQCNNSVVLTPGNFNINGGFKKSKPKYYLGDYPIEYVLSPNDLIVSMTDLSKFGDTLGYSAKIPNDGMSYLHNQRIGFIQKTSENIDLDYLYWLMRCKHYQKYIVNSCSGSTVKHTSPKLISRFEFCLPPLEEQKAIADMLSCLDDKIELNNKINKNLEEQAQALFKRWFVNFEFPDKDGNPYKSCGGEMVDSELGSIPKDWEVVELGKFFPVITGKKNANCTTENGLVPFFSCSQNTMYTDNYSFDGKAILIAGNGDFNIKRYSGKFEAYQRTYVLLPYDEKLFGLLYFLIQNSLSEITSKFRGSVISFITKGNIENFKVAFPQGIMDDSFQIFDKINKKLLAVEVQNQKLAELRDYLLPKLMSGEIRVN